MQIYYDWSEVPGDAAPVAVLVFALQSLYEYLNVLRFTYVVGYFDERTNEMLTVKRSQLERSTEFLFAATNPIIDIAAMDFRAIRCARCSSRSARVRAEVHARPRRSVSIATRTLSDAIFSDVADARASDGAA